MKLVDSLYENQNNWNTEDFYQLARNINRLFNYTDKKVSEIDSLDLSRMSAITKTIMAAIVYGKDEIFSRFPNLQELKDIKPLPEKFNLIEVPLDYHKGFIYYNIGW